MPTAERLPRGRHGLTRDEVEQDQRLRLLVGMAEAMHEKGYVGTPVADVLRHAGVSRETFYRLYPTKLHCFLDAFDVIADVLVVELALEGPGSPLERFDAALGRYLDTLAEHPAYAKLFLVEVHAAGPEAMAKRSALQQRLVDALADELGGDAFTWQVLVAAIGAMVTGPLVAGDLDALRALHDPLVEHARRLLSTQG